MEILSWEVNETLVSETETFDFKSETRPRPYKVFTTLHGMQTPASAENSVCPSNAWIVTKRKEDLSRFFIPYERSFSLVFWWVRPFLHEIFWSTGPRWSEIANFKPIFAHSA